MYKILLSSALLFSIAAPLTTDAYWWNPLTWSWNDATGTASIKEGTEGADLPTSKNTEAAPLPKAPGTVIKYVDNPALSLQVEELMKENKALNQFIVSLHSEKSLLTSQLAQCKVDATAKEQVMGSSGVGGAVVNADPCRQAKDAMYNLKQEQLDESAKYTAVHDGAKTTMVQTNKAEVDQISVDIKKQQLEIDRFCD